jgi:plasmid stability protein
MSEAVMAQVIVRELEEVVKQELKRRAARHGISMEEEIREILRNAVRQEHASPSRLGSRIAARFRGQGLDRDLPELQGTEARAAAFGE